MDKEQFLFPTPPIDPNSDVNFFDIVTINNLNNFSNHVSILTNMAIGGKINSDEAYQGIKQWYKILKKSHKTLKNGTEI